MDVNQRLEEVKQMAIGLKELGFPQHTHGNLLAALYFCEGVTALPAVVGPFQEHFIAECLDRHARTEASFVEIFTDLLGLRVLVDKRFDAQFDALVHNNHALAELSKGLNDLFKERGGTHETIPAGQEDSEADRKWAERNALAKGTDLADRRDVMLESHDVG